jgi:hypothetical protein
LEIISLALQKAGFTWGNYGGYAFHYIRELAALPGNHTRDGLSVQGNRHSWCCLPAAHDPHISHSRERIVAHLTIVSSTETRGLAETYLGDGSSDRKELQLPMRVTAHKNPGE